MWNYTGKAPEADKRDLLSELEVMKTLNPHPHVIKLLGCVTESGKTLTLWTFTVAYILGAYLIASIVTIVTICWLIAHIHCGLLRIRASDGLNLATVMMSMCY